MVTKNRVPANQLTEGDEEFRGKFVSWNLADLTAVDVAEYLKVKDVIMIPLASNEQHGPHLPLGTDVITALAISQRVCELIAILHTPPVWAGYSPQHMFNPGEGRGTVTLRSSTLQNLLHDICRSLIHHGFNRLFFVNGHNSNEKVIDPVLRKLRYETGVLVGFVNPLMMNNPGVLAGLMESPPEEIPGWHASELETSQDLAWNPNLVRMERARFMRAETPDYLPPSFTKRDGSPEVEFDGQKYFKFAMDYADFTPTGGTGNPTRASAEKGEEAFARFADHIARGILELSKVPVEVHNRTFVDRVL
jgi:creatinine amidohydrolase